MVLGQTACDMFLPTQPPFCTPKATKAILPKEEKEDYLESSEGKEDLRKQEISRAQDNIDQKNRRRKTRERSNPLGASK